MSNASDFVIESNELKKYLGQSEDVIVPKGVKIIGEQAFYGNKSVVNVRLPYGVREIQSHAFSGCSSLQTIHLPKSLKYISMFVFEGCYELRDLSIPETTEVSGLGNFSAKHKFLLDSNGFIMIGNRLLGYFGDNRIVHVPEDAQVIGQMAFAYRPLDLLIIHGSPEIDPSIFGLNQTDSRDNMQPIWFPDLELESVPKNYKKAAIAGFFYMYRTNPKCVNARKPEYIRYLKTQRKRYYDSVINDENLLGMFLAESVISAADALQLLEKNMDRLSPSAIALLMDYTKDYHPENAQGSLMNLSEEKALTLAELKKQWSYKELKDGTLCITSYKGDLDEVVIPDKIGKKTVSEIGEYAFSPYQDRVRNTKARFSIKRVVIPETVKEIGACAFSNCQSLIEMSVPRLVKRINASTFNGCSHLERISLTKSVKKILGFPFYQCPNLSIHAPAGSYAEQYAKENNIPFVAE